MNDPFSRSWRAARLAEHDRIWAARLHRAAVHRSIAVGLVAVSRLGNGVLWYALMVALPLLGGPVGRHCGLVMFGVGVVDLALYKWLKRYTGRARPFESCPDIRACAPKLDEFSFPSGHALHAIAFTKVIVFFYPAAALMLWPLAWLICVSRVVLGMHYPSDVIAGGVIGWMVASAALAFFP